MKIFHNAYLQIFKSQPVTILEIGSRDGDDAELMRALSEAHPLNVFIVEPHPESYKKIIEKYPQFRTFELAVSDKTGVVDFNAIPYAVADPGHVGTSSLLKKEMMIYMRSGGRVNVENWVKVLAVTGQTILQLSNRFEMDLVKIDVEGMTYEVLKSFGNDLRLLKMLHLEVELIQVWEDQQTFEKIKEYLKFYGFQELYYAPKYLGGNQGDSVWRRLD